MGTRTKFNYWILFFILPALVIVITIIVAPLFMSFYNSFFSWDGYIRGKFVGMVNFIKLFTAYPYQERFFNAIRNNVKWFVMVMLIQNTIGMLFGYLLSRRIRGHNIYKKILFLPVLLSIVAVGFLWKLYYTPQFGLVDKFLLALGQGDKIRIWLGDSSIATYSIITVNIWRWIGFPTLVFHAAIDSAPVDCIESAILDGAGAWKVFKDVLLPLMVPAITVITVLTLIGSLNVFEQVYTMAGFEAGPSYSTDTLGTLFYRTAFGGAQSSGMPEIAVGSALSVVIYFLTTGFSLISIITLQKKEVEL